jgi:hypothetical protein
MRSLIRKDNTPLILETIVYRPHLFEQQRDTAFVLLNVFKHRIVLSSHHKPTS